MYIKKYTNSIGIMKVKVSIQSAVPTTKATLE